MKYITLVLAFVIALPSAMSTAQTRQPRSTFFISDTSDSNSTPICDVDTTAAPQMAEFAKKIPALCEANYAKIKRKLIADSFQPPRKIHIIFKNDFPDPAQALGDKIILGSDWFTKHPKDLGAIVHELAHVVQSYPQGQPSWLVEGIADYIRYWRGYRNSLSYPHCGEASEHYTSGYWCGAAFLGYIEKNHDRKIIVRLNKALRENSYNESLFVRYTGKSLEQLWQKCREKDCKGGRP